MLNPLPLPVTLPAPPVAPAAPEFPVTWPDPADAERHWKREREHFPDPITPMYFSTMDMFGREGCRRVFDRYPDAIVDRLGRRINTYFYTSAVRFDGPPDALAARVAGTQAAIEDVMWRLDSVWRQEWLPELQRAHAFWDDFSLRSADPAALDAHLDETLERGARLWEIHFLIAAPVWTALHQFERLYAEIHPTAGSLAAQRLLQGFDNKTLELGRALWQLSQEAARRPEVVALLREPGGRLAERLRQSRGGRAFLGALREFLRSYGRRSNLWDWGYPSWIEDPGPVLAHIRATLSSPAPRNPATAQQAAALARETAIAATRARLRGADPALRERFERLLPVAQAALRISEDHNFYLDFTGMYRVRRVLLEYGRRLQADGSLAAPRDLFYLTLPEVRAAFAARQPTDLRPLAATRRAEMARWARVSPPLELGRPAPTDLPVATPAARRQVRIFDTAGPGDAGVVRGLAGAPGRVRGRACVIHSLADSARLQRGAILVTTTTAPPWTPLFGIAAAVVTDMGGPLTHGAICAREYGIPAVVGTGQATSRIRDGQWIEVDGSAGLVRLLPDPPAG